MCYFSGVVICICGSVKFCQVFAFSSVTGETPHLGGYLYYYIHLLVLFPLSGDRLLNLVINSLGYQCRVTGLIPH